jgi:hypothetical protein
MRLALILPDQLTPEQKPVYEDMKTNRHREKQKPRDRDPAAKISLQIVPASH